MEAAVKATVETVDSKRAAAKSGSRQSSRTETTAPDPGRTETTASDPAARKPPPPIPAAA